MFKFIISLENSEGHKYDYMRYDFYKKYKFYKEHASIIEKYNSLEKCDKKCNKEIISLLILRQRYYRCDRTKSRGGISLPEEIIFIIYKKLFELKPCLCIFKLMNKNIF